MAIVYEYDWFLYVRTERRRRLNRIINKNTPILDLCRTIETVVGASYNEVSFGNAYLLMTRDQLDHVMDEVEASSEEDWRRYPEYYLAASKAIRNRFPFLEPRR